MRFPAQLKPALLIILLAVVVGVIEACGGSKANVRKEETTATPKVVDVTTAAAIRRDLPEFVEATGSLAGDEQTDVAPQTSGKVVEVGFDIGSAVRRDKCWSN